ncbi:DUF4145 domain-containing protein [Anaerobacterium chartisolvens]|nr:DUF4145 domain-containing protein [Anaerobacterium chartisolvens]
MIGANSACISMYRAALEQILYNQGYINGMLNSKIKDLEKDINDGTGKEWTKSLDKDLFSYIKDLGNGSIHPNGGDISKQSTFDDDLVVSIDLLFREFLDEIYEKPIRKASIKSVLSNAANKVNK